MEEDWLIQNNTTLSVIHNLSSQAMPISHILFFFFNVMELQS